MPLQLKVIFDPPLSKSFEVEEPKLLAIGRDVMSVPDEEIGKVQASFQFYSGGVSVTSFGPIPMTKGNDSILYPKDVELEDGDRLCLVKGKYPFTVRITNVSKPERMTDDLVENLGESSTKELSYDFQDLYLGDEDDDSAGGHNRSIFEDVTFWDRIIEAQRTGRLHGRNDVIAMVETEEDELDNDETISTESSYLGSYASFDSDDDGSDTRERKRWKGDRQAVALTKPMISRVVPETETTTSTSQWESQRCSVNTNISFETVTVSTDHE
ncbi:4458_t:CDS:2 [Paraglomus brasilianum]|uniref:4458_t:CDS:1 n=1 Tax=Paraglomus brasilianum TaxID=144538 RepID=A0A9N8ZPS5_9GLOM|nr:4458_t:CDS:2 [Paraglomus brasilianum]